MRRGNRRAEEVHSKEAEAAGDGDEEEAAWDEYLPGETRSRKARNSLGN